MQSDEQAVIAAAEQRAAALAAADADELRRLMHPALRWTTHTGSLLDRDSYISGNTDGSLVCHQQRLEQPSVAVVGDTAVLTALVIDEVERDGHRDTFRLRLTQTWVREGRTWRCIAGHAGPLL
jgi:ketosteroid isomerase-like protein